ncbi:hypothetical protein FPZ54_15360 [Sphingomonas suaedae]|uniref:Secreted protein n=1 Tax=Sphingomonas suaedae TaxID=2599297 RepID=A0A518RIG0_9SPHN|nr:hypothetical protein [Sphingomonas suaedae]QDX27245.1 hypothetical protein FPZ54_15360 [Sphingomonas suaedae]
MLVAAFGFAIALASAAPSGDDNVVAAPVKEKKICKAEAATGTRLARRKICRTAAEWDAIQKQAVQDAREIQDNTQNRYSGN